MARDYKRPARRKARAARGDRSGWLWLSGGLVLGAMLGYAGYLLQSGAGAPAAEAKPPAAEHQASPVAVTRQAPAPKEPEEAPAQRNRFEFYTLLPEMEMEITDERIEDALKTPPRETARAPDGPYILQVGSFRKLEEADSLKARLAMIGIEAKIQTVIIRDEDVWHRVRVGPYDSLRALGQARSRLQRNDIDFMVLRIGT